MKNKMVLILWTLLLALPNSGVALSNNKSNSQKIIALEDCESQTLFISFSPRISERNLNRAIETLNQYPGLEVTELPGQNTHSAFLASVPECKDTAMCAYPTEWDELQIRLKKVPGTKVTCEPIPDQAEDQSPAPPGGGVTGSN